MEVVYRCCCGIDVHKNLIVACLRKGSRQELRELTRYRKSIIEERSRKLNRLQKVLEGAKIKLGSVVADIHSKSTQRLLERLAAGEAMDDSSEISKLLHKSLLPKLAEIVAALDGIVTPLQRALLTQILDHIDDLDKRIQEPDQMTEAHESDQTQELPYYTPVFEKLPFLYNLER